jgi:hypothetical protein
MSAISKSVRAFVAIAMFSTVASAQAGMGPCMAMPMMPGAGGAGCGEQAAPRDRVQACPVQDERSAQEAGCASNAQFASTLGEMAAGGIGIARTVIGAIFGATEK